MSRPRVSDPDHPAADWIDEAADEADEGIRLEMDGLATTASLNTEVAGRILAAVDKALEIAPDDPDLLVAKAAARTWAPGDEEVEALLDRALSIEPGHFDARMRRDHPQSWENVLLFPAFSEDMRTLPQVMGQYLQLGQLVQVVRDKLELTLAVVIPSPSEGFPVIDRSRWEMMWVKTPFGRVAEHYTVLDIGGETRAAEGVIPHLAEAQPGVRNGYWILRRMAHVSSMILAFADGHKVIYSSRYRIPAEERRSLSAMADELERSGPATDRVAVQQAADWHVQNFELDSIRF